MLEEKAFHSLTIGEISERATVNRPTFYSHFNDKLELLGQDMQKSVEEVLGNTHTSVTILERM